MSTLNWNLFVNSNVVTTEAELVISLQEGNQHAFAKMIEQHTPRLLATARRFLRSEDDAQDALQEAFLSAYKGLASFHGQSQLGTWLHRIVVNACLMKLRKQARRLMLPLDDLLPDKVDVASLVTDDVDADPLERDEQHELIHRYLRELPDSYREIILLRNIEEQSTEEVAIRLGITAGAVKTRLHRAHQALKSIMVHEAELVC